MTAPDGSTPLASRTLGVRPRERSWLAEDASTIAVLIARDLVRFVREKSRIAGALLQPLLFWLIIGSGMSGTFVLGGPRGLSYLEYFYPGVVVMVALFAAIFTTMSVIEDRHSGFLQAVLVAPGSRASVVIGKCAGAALVALSQSTLFLVLAPLAGLAFSAMDFPLLITALTLTCFGFCAVGFAVAWWLDSTAGYHVVMSLVLLPAWILSGAMFPAPATGALAVLVRANPMSYAVSAVRRAVYGDFAPEGTLLAGSHAGLELGVLLALSGLSCALALWVCHRRR